MCFVKGRNCATREGFGVFRVRGSAVGHGGASTYHGEGEPADEGSQEHRAVRTTSIFWQVLRYIEANALRAALVKRAEDYAWSSYRVHGLDEVNELVDRLIT